MSATLLFYRSADSKTHPEYFGALTNSSPYARHYQVGLGEDGLPDWQCWTVRALTQAQFDVLETTYPLYEPPWPIEQRAFLTLLKMFVLPPLPL